MKLISILLSLFLCGCAQRMPLRSGLEEPPPSEKSQLVFFTVETGNEFTNYAPKPGLLEVKPTAPNGSSTMVLFDEPIKQLGEKGYLSMGSISLPEGEYYLTVLNGGLASFPIFGEFYFDPRLKFRTLPNQKTYLGRIKLTLVKKTSPEEERAGHILPLIDQAVTGLSNGTFKVTVSDALEEDMGIFKSAVSNFKSDNITKSILMTY